MAVVASLVVITACKKEIEDYVPKEFLGANESSLRVINTATSPKKIALFINGQKYSGDTLAYPSTFPSQEFLRVPGGDVTFKAITPIDNAEVLSRNLTFPAGKFNTLFLIDTLPAIDAYLVTDDQLMPPADSGKAAIRFVHVATGVGNLKLANNTVSTAVDTLVSSIGYKSHTPFITVNSGSSQRFQLYLAGTNTTFANNLVLSLTPNRMYTLYVRGRAGVTGTFAPTLTGVIAR